MTTCPESERIQDFLDGVLPPGQALLVREHVGSCERCARDLALYRRVFLSLEKLPTWDPGPALTARVLDRVLPSRVRRRWVRTLGLGYATVLALSVAGMLSLVTHPASRALLESLSAGLSRRLAQAMMFGLNALSFTVLSFAGGERLLASVGERLAPIGRALAVLFSQPAVTVPLSIAVAACAVVLWWMRPRKAGAGRGGHHVSVLGF